jgi:hypothetical protein
MFSFETHSLYINGIHLIWTLPQRTFNRRLTSTTLPSAIVFAPLLPICYIAGSLTKSLTWLSNWWSFC